MHPTSFPPFHLSLSLMHTHTDSVYINHRPAFGLSPIDLIRAFKSLASSYNTDDGVSDGAGFTVDRGTLLAMLQENGNHCNLHTYNEVPSFWSCTCHCV